MAPRHRLRTTDTTESIRSAVGMIFSCGDFSSREFSLPSDKGAQLSLTGEIIAYGNCGNFNETALRNALTSIPTVWHPTEKDLVKYLTKKCFTVLCGDCDRSVAMVSAISEIFKSGISKVIITADTPTERDNIIESLGLMRSGIDGVEVTPYRSDDYEVFVKYKAAASVYGFLTSENREILVISRDSFARKNNIINRTDDNDIGDNQKSLSELLANVHAAILCSSPTVSSARTLAKISSVFSPTATLLFAGETRNLRDAVIFRPENTVRRQKIIEEVSFEQIMF